MNDIFYISDRGIVLQKGTQIIQTSLISQFNELVAKRNQTHKLNLYLVHRRLNSYVSDYSFLGWSIHHGGHLYC